jgi:ERCC4-related helicase
MPGKLIILITKKTRDETSYWASFQREKKMYSTIDSIKEDLKNGKIKEDRQKTL